MDYQTLLYDPVYLVQGVSAVITLSDATTVLKPVTVLDKTAGTEIKMAVDILTILPAAVLRVKELAKQNYVPDDLHRGKITFNGRTWTIVDNRLIPSPNGMDDGEAYMILED